MYIALTEQVRKNLQETALRNGTTIEALLQEILQRSLGTVGIEVSAEIPDYQQSWVYDDLPASAYAAWLHQPPTAEVKPYFFELPQ